MPGGIDYDYQDLHRDARVPEPDTVSRRGLRTITGLITSLFTIFLVAVVALGVGFVYLQSELKKEGPLQEQKLVLIERGQGTRNIAETLQNAGAIANDKIFLLGVFANRVNGKLKAGEYSIDAHASMIDIIDLLVAGKSKQYKITLPEGLTTAQILERVRENDILDGEIEGDVPEGSLLPDTHYFPRGTTRQEVIKWMQNAQKKLLDEQWPKRAKNLPLSSPEEAIILASIVEKETGVAAERAHIAGVFINRLKRHMRLQSDPTIIYGKYGAEGAQGRKILKSDIAEKTAYNTYQIDGLPPTPIANPGRAAIEAVLHPADTKDLFFVADGTGGHVFAETNADHERNAARWKEIERQRNEPQTPAADDAAQPAADDKAQDDNKQTAALQPDADASPDAMKLDADAKPDADVNPDADAKPDANASPDADANADADAKPDQEPQADNATQPEPPSADAADAKPDATPAPDAQAETQKKAVPVPSPKPEKPAGSEIARATIEKAPLPKPKPPAPRRREAPSDSSQSQVNVTPLPDTPAADPDDATSDPTPPPETTNTDNIR